MCRYIYTFAFLVFLPTYYQCQCDLMHCTRFVFMLLIYSIVVYHVA